MLTAKQSLFLDRLSPWALEVDYLSQLKAYEYRSLRSYGFSAILFAAVVIEATDWGTHPLSREEYRGKLANNLTLLPSNSWWDGKKILYKDKEYKLFSSWEEFCIHFSDLVVFDKKYKDILLERSYLKQIKLYSLLTDEPKLMYTKLVNILDQLGIPYEQQEHLSLSPSGAEV